MTKYLTVIFALCALVACKEAPVVPGNAQNPPMYKKTDLQKLRWIEGNWKSEVAGPGFYQSCYFPSDTSLEVVSYQFDGKDTLGTTTTTVYWRNNHLYIGSNGEWVAVLLDKKAAQFDPLVQGWFSIQWTQNTKDEWTMVQKKPDFVRTIKMKRQPPLEELLKSGQ